LFGGLATNHQHLAPSFTGQSQRQAVRAPYTSLRAVLTSSRHLHHHTPQCQDEQDQLTSSLLRQESVQQKCAAFAKKAFERKMLTYLKERCVWQMHIRGLQQCAQGHVCKRVYETQGMLSRKFEMIHVRLEEQVLNVVRKRTRPGNEVAKLGYVQRNAHISIKTAWKGVQRDFKYLCIRLVI
jgi:hypothetical protein